MSFRDHLREFPVYNKAYNKPYRKWPNKCIRNISTKNRAAKRRRHHWSMGFWPTYQVSSHKKFHETLKWVNGWKVNKLLNFNCYSL